MIPSKKAQNIGALLTIGMTFVILTIGLALGLQVSGDFRDDIGTDACPTGTWYYNKTSDMCHSSALGGAANYTDPTSEEYNASVKGIEGLAKFPKKLPIIATVLVAVILIGLLVRNLMMRMR